MNEPVNDPWRLLDNCNHMIGRVESDMRGREEAAEGLQGFADRTTLLFGAAAVLGLVVALTPDGSPLAPSPGMRAILCDVLALGWMVWLLISTYCRVQIRRILRARHNFVTRARFLLVHIDLALHDKSPRDPDAPTPASLRERAGLLAGLIDGTPWEAR